MLQGSLASKNDVSRGRGRGGFLTLWVHWAFLGSWNCWSASTRLKWGLSDFLLWKFPRAPYLWDRSSKRFLLLMCVYVCVCVRVFVHVHMLMHVEAKGQHQVSFLRYHLLKQKQSPGSFSGLGLAQEARLAFQLASGICLSLSLQIMCATMRDFLHEFREQIQVLSLGQVLC